jgi:hypothetical protein
MEKAIKVINEMQTSGVIKFLDEKGGAMKKTVFLFVFLVAIMALLACGGDKTRAGEPASSVDAVTKTEAAAPTGKAYDCKYFTITLADGWDAGPLTFGMVNVLPKGKVSPGLYFKFEGDGSAVGTAEASISTMIRDYGGSPMEDNTIAGTMFKTTTYTYNNMTQTMHVAYRNGTKITITIEGAGAKDNPDIKAMLATVVLK